MFLRMVTALLAATVALTAAGAEELGPISNGGVGRSDEGASPAAPIAGADAASVAVARGQSVIASPSLDRILSRIPGDATVVYVVADPADLIDHPMAPASRAAPADAALRAALKRTFDGPAAVALMGSPVRPGEARWMFVCGVTGDAEALAERINKAIGPALKAHPLAASIGTVHAAVSGSAGGTLSLGQLANPLNFRINDGILIAETSTESAHPSAGGFAARSDVIAALQEGGDPAISMTQWPNRLFFLDPAACSTSLNGLATTFRPSARAPQAQDAPPVGNAPKQPGAPMASAWLFVGWRDYVDIRLSCPSAPESIAPWLEGGCDLRESAKWFPRDAAGVIAGRGPIGRLLGLTADSGPSPELFWITRLFRGFRELSPQGAAALAEQLTGEWSVGASMDADDRPDDICWVFGLRDSAAAAKAISIAVSGAGGNAMRNDIHFEHLAHFRTSDGLLTLCVTGRGLLASAEPQAVVHAIEFAQGGESFATRSDLSELWRRVPAADGPAALIRGHDALLFVAHGLGNDVNPAWVRLSRNCPMGLLTAKRDDGWTIHFTSSNLTSGQVAETWRSLSDILGRTMRQAQSRPAAAPGSVP